MDIDKLSRLRSAGYVLADDLKICGFFGEFSFLSNMYKSNFFYHGALYNSSEQAYMAAKCLFANDFAKMLEITEPSKCKHFGRTVQLVPAWDKVKLNVMKFILYEKFNTPRLKQMLLATGNRHLEEANYWNDKYWGTFYGNGQNNLGKILMEVRNSIKNAA